MQITYRSSLPFPTSSRFGAVMDKLTALEFGLGSEFIEFRHVLESFPAPILITSADAHIVYANPAWENLTGHSLQETMGKNPNILQSGKTEKKYFKKMWQALKKGETFNSEELIDKRKDGTEYQINTIIFPIIRNGITLFYVQVEQDITNRKKLEELKREFLSTATHELKTPITTLKLLIQSQLHNLINKQFRKVKIKELQLIDRELNRLINIIDDLSDVSRIETGKLQMDMKFINISSIIKDTAHQMLTIAKTHPIVIKYALPIYVVADEGRIKQVLINLVKNAFKYSYPKSEVVMSTKVQDGHCVVSVQNKGVGIPKSKQPYIFDRFYQLNSGNNSGLGLGLYISKKIVEQHRGKLWVESEQGNLTTFYFSLVIVDGAS